MDDSHPSQTDARAMTALATGYTLRIVDHDRTLEVYAPDGRMCVQLVLTPEGPHIELSGASLAIRTDRALTVDCERFDLRATSGMTFRSGGPIELATTAGDLQIRAAEDVQVDGARILLNSPKPAMPAEVITGVNALARQNAEDPSCHCTTLGSQTSTGITGLPCVPSTNVHRT